MNFPLSHLSHTLVSMAWQSHVPSSKREEAFDHHVSNRGHLDQAARIQQSASLPKNLTEFAVITATDHEGWKPQDVHLDLSYFKYK